jgi:hypothetical protein
MTTKVRLLGTIMIASILGMITGLCLGFYITVAVLGAVAGVCYVSAMTCILSGRY